MSDDPHERLLASVPEAFRPMVESMRGMQEAFRDKRVSATDHNEVITAETDVFGSLKSITFHPMARRRYDNLTLGDLVAEAVNAAVVQARVEYHTLLNEVQVFGVPLGDLRKDPGAAARRFVADFENQRPR